MFSDSIPYSLVLLLRAGDDPVTLNTVGRERNGEGKGEREKKIVFPPFFSVLTLRSCL